jgi:hypothetical protein
MAKPFFRKSIPDKSVLTVLVSGEGEADEQKFTAEGELEHADGKKDSWDDQDLRQGVTQTLRSPGVYTGRVDVNFAAKSTARLQMTIDKPDGTKHVYDEKVSRSSGLDRTSILLVMKKSS